MPRSELRSRYYVGESVEMDEFIAKNINTMFSMDCGSMARTLSKDEPDKKETKQKKKTRSSVF